jgi:opacity protein-like surface antigen
MKNIFLILISFLLWSNFLKSQSIDQTFRPVIYANVVASQVDGDTYGGYSKPGFMVGLGINRQLSKLIEVEFALTFIQKGARHNYGLDSASRNNPNNPFFLSRLNYLEIPLTLKINYKKFKAELGGAAAYLAKNPPFEDGQNGTWSDPNYRKFDFSYIVGVGYKLKPNLLANLRFEYSIITIRPYQNPTTGVYHGQFPYSLFNQGLYNNLLQLGLHYRIPTKAEAEPKTPNVQ